MTNPQRTINTLFPSALQSILASLSSLQQAAVSADALSFSQLHQQTILSHIQLRSAPMTGFFSVATRATANDYFHYVVFSINCWEKSEKGPLQSLKEN